MRRFLIAGLVTAASVCATADAMAQAMDGTWTGTTERGGSVQITVAKNQAQSYVFRGQSVPVHNSKATGNGLTFTAGNIGTVTLTGGKGKTAAYTYSDTQGGSAKATLTRP
jgi:hypothetical protein